MIEDTQTTRRRLLNTAAALFFRDGYRAVGVDTIVAASGISKMTLYRPFSSTDDVSVA
jgi:AcrR family transcriptional regulator